MPAISLASSLARWVPVGTVVPAEVAGATVRDALAALFENGHDPVTIIKWKDIYQDLETATDRCEDVANVIEGIVLKNA